MLQMIGVDFQTAAKNMVYTQHAGTALVDGHIHYTQTHISPAYYTLPAAMQAVSMVEWVHDLRPVFEVRRGREWKVMDLCFMTCFTGTVPSQSAWLISGLPCKF